MLLMCIKVSRMCRQIFSSYGEYMYVRSGEQVLLDPQSWNLTALYPYS